MNFYKPLGKICDHDDDDNYDDYDDDDDDKDENDLEQNTFFLENWK